MSFLCYSTNIFQKKFISGKTKEKVKLRTQQFDGQDKLFLAGIAF